MEFPIRNPYFWRDRFAAAVLNQMISEYDITTSADDALAADYTRDIMTVCFSHPAYHGFIIWGFWEGRHRVPSAAFWKRDLTPTPAARMSEDLIGEQWHARETLTSDARGIWRLALTKAPHSPGVILRGDFLTSRKPGGFFVY